MGIPIVEDIYWVGTHDWDLRDFHGLTTPLGGSYNAYLIKDNKKALVDTVYSGYSTELLNKIDSLVGLNDVDYIISNHSEADHSGALPDLLKHCSKAKLVTNSKGRDMLSNYYEIPSSRFFIVKDGQELSLGENTLQFFELPMLHWPETMFTYMKQKKVLFPCDFLGTQIALSPITIKGMDEILILFRDYYTFLMRAYNRQVLKGIEKVRMLNPDIVAPSHGPVLTDNAVDQALNLYEKWSTNPERQKAVIIYVSLWGGTKKIAGYLAQGIAASGCEVRVLDLASTPLSQVISETLEAGGIVLGCPTFVRGIHPMMAAFLELLKMIKPENKKAMVFGTFGWGENAGKIIKQRLSDLKINMIEDPIEIKLAPKTKDSDIIKAKGLKFGNTIKDIY